MAPSANLTLSNLTLTRIRLALLVLLGAITLSACPSQKAVPEDDDRPPIIISSGSVRVDLENPTPATKWTARGGKDYDQDVTRGKSVTRFIAETLDTGNTVQCTFNGGTITVLYGSRLIVFTTKDDRVNSGRKAANVQFPADASVNDTQAAYGKLTVETMDALVSVWNESGSSCSAAGLKIRVKQVTN
jgi:hypothetical protein